MTERQKRAKIARRYVERQEFKQACLETGSILIISGLILIARGFGVV